MLPHLLYTTALTRELLLSTRDREFVEFLRRNCENMNIIVCEEVFTGKYANNA